MDIYLFFGNDTLYFCYAYGDSDVAGPFSYRFFWWEGVIFQRQRIGLASRILQSSDCRAWDVGSINGAPAERWRTSTFGRFEHASLRLVFLVSLRIWLLYLHVFLKKNEGDIVIASVRPLCYLLLNHWTKFNQIWCVSYSHELGAQR